MVIGPSVVSGGFGPEPREVLHDRIVEAQLALLTQLHDRDSGEQLAVRGHAELRRRRHLQLRVGIGESEALAPDEFLIAHDTDHDPREPSYAICLSIHAENSRSAPGTSGSSAASAWAAAGCPACVDEPWMAEANVQAAATAIPSVRGVRDDATRRDMERP